MAWYYQGTLHLGYALLAGFGLVLTHISVNTLNDYFDYKSGIDLRTKVTPFSGGSGILKAGLLKPGQVLAMGIITLLLAAPVGVYFIIVQGWLLLPLLIVAALCVIFYSPVILKHTWPEWSAGLGLGMLPVLGMYFAQTGVYSCPALLGAVPSFILVHNLLLLNEFPDVEADSSGGRKTLPITMGKKKTAKFYTAMTIFLYLWIAGCIIAGVSPIWTLLAFLTLPFAVLAMRGSFYPEDEAGIIAAMKNNVLVVLATQFLLGVGYLLAALR